MTCSTLQKLHNVHVMLDVNKLENTTARQCDETNLGPYLLKLASQTPGSLPQIVQWSISYALFNFCTRVLNHPVLNPWRYSSEEPRPTEAVAAR